MDSNQQSAIVEMSCTEVRALNVDYLDGSLGLDAFMRVDMHLEHCPHCAAIYDGIRNVVALLACGELFPVPGELDEKICDFLNGSEGAQRS
jgi:hypothetical protein